MIQHLFELIEHTHRSIFLTGKAGTGKTTFLNDFVKRTKKKHIVVAPTGIAAINAGGSTIHSLFGLPLRPFAPTTERIDGSLANNITDLIRHFRYRKNKLKLLREIELIIIDEVSMLRADVLDMMDFSLRHVRRNQQPFGGVQMLFIGDLYQLPPIVRDESLLSLYYTSPFFFSAKVIDQVKLATIELTEVYRQKDPKFLEILNAIRDGDTQNIDFDLLNSQFQPDFKPQEETYIYLSSHNRIADHINQKKLNDLPGRIYVYEAGIHGDFKENQYPNDTKLELKVGAQVMFIRNDATHEKKYFNGKLAEITRLSEEDIHVLIEGSDEEYKLKKEIWENKKYSLNKDKNIEEEVIGSFEQYPVRLAWAVTIHKSQGLTFDRVIIDAGQSFASGQVYVALSRCRTLDGIILKSRITPEVIFNDRRVSGFQDATNANHCIEQIIHNEKFDYSTGKLLRKLDCHWLKTEIESWFSTASESKNLNLNLAKNLHLTLKKEIENLSYIHNKFERILLQKTQKYIEGKEEWIAIENKAKGAVMFFFNEVNHKIFTPFKDFYAETKGGIRLKTYNEIAKTLLNDIEDYLKELQTLELLGTSLFKSSEITEITSKVKKIPTHIITWQMFESGKNISEIAQIRGVLLATIYGHLTKFAEQGLLKKDELQRIVTKEKISLFQKQFQKQPMEDLKSWKAVLPEDFEYSEIRLLWNFFQNITL